MNFSQIELDKHKLECLAYFTAGAVLVWSVFLLLDMAEEVQDTVRKEAFSRGYQEGILYQTTEYGLPERATNSGARLRPLFCYTDRVFFFASGSAGAVGASNCFMRGPAMMSSLSSCGCGRSRGSAVNS